MSDPTITHTSLLRLFNVELVDFVKQNKDGSYTAVEWPKLATHELVPTQWNHPRLYKPNKAGRLIMPDGFALSVCAFPLHRTGSLSHGKPIKCTRSLPNKSPQYLAEGSVEGKRTVLTWMVKHMRAQVKKSFIAEATESQCDTLYRNLIVAHHSLL